MEGRNRQTRIQDCKTKEGEFGTLKHSCMYLCVAIARTQLKSYTATKDADLFLIIVFTDQWPASDFTAPCPGLQLSDWVLLLTDCSGVSLMTDALESHSWLTAPSQVFADTALCVVFVPK